MDLARAFLLAGFLLVVICTEVEQNATELLEGETQLEAKERVRRLIPYMTYYLDQGQSQDPYLTQQYQPSAYYSPVPQPQHQQLVPVGYLVGGGYNTVPVYSAPVQREQDFYTLQQPSDLAHMIAQNYLAIAKQMGSQKKTQHQMHYAAKEPQPVQYTNSQKETEYRTTPQQTIQYVTKQQYTNRENTPINQVYKIQSPAKSYSQPRQRPRPKQINRRPVYYENNPSSQYVSQSSPYIPIQNNYEPSYDSTPKNNKYKSNPDVLSITKSQEIIIPDDTYPEPIPLLPVKTTPKPKLDYEEFLPTVPTIQQNTVLDLVAGYQQTKTLPEKFTSTNIGDSIKTLSGILKLLQTAKSKPIINLNDGDGSIDNGVSQNYSPYQTEGSTPGQAGIDYPAYAEIPQTDFDCKSQRYKGFFGDPETNCQVWHYCDLNGGQASFLCPNGTIFSQVALTCDWWFNVKCASTAQLYVLNERLYKYILPHKPSFPEDYAGPLVDEYLTLRFQEAEAKRRNATTTERPANTLQVLLSDEINQAVK